MHNVEGQLKLSYSPMTLYEFEHFKDDKDVYDFLSSTAIYVIAQRSLPIMEFVDKNANGFHVKVYMEGNEEKLEIIFRTKDNLNFFPCGISAINIGSNILNKSGVFHSLILYRKNFCGNDEFVMSANFDRLIHLASNGIIKIHIKGDITPFISYRVLYVGECIEEHIFSRFKAHHALQNILIRENIISKDYDKVNDILLLPFKVTGDVVSVIDGNSNEKEFIEAVTGNFSFGRKELVLDCEKALIKAMSPKYNKTKFKHYPKSKNGLYNHKIDSCLYQVMENIVLCYDDDNKIYGDVNGLENSYITILENKEFFVYI